MAADAQILEQIATVVRSDNDFLVTAHGGPDGDAIGSMLAMGELLKAQGRSYLLYHPDGVPDSLAFLPGQDSIVTQLPERQFEWLVILDCSGPERVSDEFAQTVQYRKALVLDHHLTERPFGDLAYVDSSAAATGEILYRLAAVLGGTPSSTFATNTYTALFTDTGSFQYTNTTAAVLQAASQLAAWGANPALIAKQITTQRRARIEMTRQVLDSMTFYANDTIAVISITQAAMAAAGAEKDDLEGLVGIPRSIDGVLIAAQIREVEPDVEYRVSLRSSAPATVEAVASSFGGGGHLHAAGCTLSGSHESVMNRLLAALERAVEQALSSSNDTER